MIRKIVLSLALVSLIPIFCGASSPDREVLHFACEWGPAFRALEFHRYNFVTDEGFRVDESGASIGFFVNGYVDFRMGVLLSDYVSMSVGTGIVGYGRKEHVIPIMVRGDYKINGYRKDGPVSFAEAGIGLSPDNTRPDVLLAKAGVGYRYTLGDYSGLELTLGVSAAASHPEIWSDSEMRYIPESDVRRNDAMSIALVLGIAIDF